MIQTRIDNLWHKNAYGVWIFDRSGNQTRIAKPTALEFGEPQNDCFLLPEPTLELRPEFAQAFFQSMLDEMAKHGFRANNDKTQGMLEAQTAHLKDMQRLVFK